MLGMSSYAFSIDSDSYFTRGVLGEWRGVEGSGGEWRGVIRNPNNDISQYRVSFLKIRLLKFELPNRDVFHGIRLLNQGITSIFSLDGSGKFYIRICSTKK